MTTRRLRYLLRWLRKTHPLDMPVIVRRWPDRDAMKMGNARRRSSCYFIWINSVLPAIAQEFILTEEYAHCMAWSAQEMLYEEIAHDILWALAYSRLRQEYGGTE